MQRWNIRLLRRNWRLGHEQPPSRIVQPRQITTSSPSARNQVIYIALAQQQSLSRICHYPKYGYCTLPASTHNLPWISILCQRLPARSETQLGIYFTVIGFNERKLMSFVMSAFESSSVRRRSDWWWFDFSTSDEFIVRNSNFSYFQQHSGWRRW